MTVRSEPSTFDAAIAVGIHHIRRLAGHDTSPMPALGTPEHAAWVRELNGYMLDAQARAQEWDSDERPLTRDELVDALTAAAEEGVRAWRAGERPHGPDCVRCQVCYRARDPLERFCPVCGEQWTTAHMAGI